MVAGAIRDRCGPIGPLKHLEKEERGAYIEDNWHKRVDEIADCLLLTLDAARRHGLSFDELTEAAFSKLERNKQRTWPAGISDEPVEHIEVYRVRYEKGGEPT